MKVAGDRPRPWIAGTPFLRWTAAAVSVFSIAAASAPQASSGKLAGFIAGAILIGLVAYALFDYLRPVIDDRDSGITAALLVLGALAAVKLAVMPFFPGFGPDVGDYQAWAGQIATYGPAHTYQAGFFLDYPPGYLYALWVVGLIAHVIGASGDFYRVIIESPAIVADFALALLMYAFVRRGSRPAMAFIAMLMVALNPPLLFDTVVWGQSDSVMAFVTLLSIVAILGRQYEIGWGLAAIAVLVKPQGLMILPVLGVWTMLEADFATWIRSGVALIAVAIIGIAPFQIGHEWNWIFKLYTSTAAYYHETSVNAFNLMALIGGLRQADSGTFLGVSYFALGMSLLVPLYGFIAWILWRGRTPTRLLFASFIAIFGFFMVAPRMHERYLYPAVVLAVPLALEAPEMLAVFVLVSITSLINLAYILHTLNTVVFLDARDGLAMATSALNVVALALAAYYGATRLQGETELNTAVAAFFGRFTMPPRRVEDYVEEPAVAPAWIATDTIIISALLIVAAITRFWHLGHPNEIVFDEVHFVAQGRHYLHGESFLDPHPPLAKLIIAAGIFIFGDHPWSWRVGNATLGTAIVGITYLLGRRMSGSRLVGALAGAIILCDGMYLVDSHYAVIDIVYLTCAAVAYLLFFRFAQTPDAAARRRILPWIGLVLGLCLASKFYIPAITFLLVMGFILYVLAKDRPKAAPAAPPVVEPKAPIDSKAKKIKVPAPVPIRIDLFDRTWRVFTALTYVALLFMLYLFGETFLHAALIASAAWALRIVEMSWRNRSSSAATAWQMPSLAILREPMSVGAVALVGSVAAIVYLAVFLPHYWFGWWGGISDLFYYYGDIIWYEKSVASASHPYASPWWSWPLMLRPIAYWQNFPKTGDVQTVWGGGNPLLWWGALTAITITAVNALERPNLTRWFLVIGYLSYLLIWAWIGRTLFLYHYMASVYFGYLALAILLGECFKERAEPWEHLALLLTMTPVFFLGMPPTWGWITFIVVIGAYGFFLLQTPYAGRYVGSVFVAVALILFVYYFPIWVGMPISRDGYYARMWLQAAGLRNWI
ncbi:MAG: phospholipid carrier-dependent glycosyltransferase [Candidatus Binatus sp.]